MADSENLADINLEKTLRSIISTADVVHGFGSLAIRSGANPSVVRRQILIAAESLRLVANDLTPPENTPSHTIAE